MCGMSGNMAYMGAMGGGAGVAKCCYWTHARLHLCLSLYKFSFSMPCVQIRVTTDGCQSRKGVCVPLICIVVGGGRLKE